MQRLSSTSYFWKTRGFGINAPVAGRLVVLRLEGLERLPIRDPEPVKVAEADGLARALEAAGRFGDNLLDAVRDLVLDVAVVAERGVHRLEPIARLLLLAREG